jgi:predicted helicase
MLQFKNIALPDEIVKDTYKLKDTRGWKLSIARNKLSEDKNWDTYYQKILYRPFDIRYIYYTEIMVDWVRQKYMRHILEENIAICFVRQYSGNVTYSHFIVSEYMVDNRTFFSSKGIIQLAPLYLYPDEKNKNLFNHTQIEKVSNITPLIFEKLSECYNKKLTPEEILYYIYGIFYSNIYRETYAEFLKIDFPRVPFTSDYDLFIKMGKLGKELSALHLLKSLELDSPIAKYQGSGDNDRIEKVIYKANEQRIYINKEKYFEGVTPEVWNYHIGGYQILRKYLKDRKDRMMDDAPRYCRIVTALYKTIEIQKQIDNIYPEIEKNLVRF